MPDDGSPVPPNRPMQVVISQDERGEAQLTVLDGTFEQAYRLQDFYARTLFLAVSRSQGYLPYRL